MNDPIVEEVRKVRDAHAARFNCDLDAIFRDLKEQENKSGRTFASFPPRKVEPDQAPQPTGAALPASQTATASEATPTAELQRSAADTELERREQAEAIARALAELPPRYEAVLRAKYLDGRSMADIAAEWGETPKAVESLLTRARQAFREAYLRAESNHD